MKGLIVGQGRGLRLRVIWTAPTVEQADLVRAVLEGQGIQAVVLDRNTLGLLPYLSMGIGRGGVRVAVDEADVEVARAAMAHHRTGPLGGAGGAGDEPHAAHEPAAVTRDDVLEELAEEIQDRRLEDLARRAAMAGVFSVFFPPLALVGIYLLLRARHLRRTENAPMTAAAKVYFRWAVVGVLLGGAIAVWLSALAAVSMRDHIPSPPPEAMF